MQRGNRLDEFNDDVLMLIVEAVSHVCTLMKPVFISHTLVAFLGTLNILAMVNKRIRNLCLPAFLRDLTVRNELRWMKR